MSEHHQSVALLGYMVKHNRHHEEELSELAKTVDEESAALISEALALFHEGNEKLEAALLRMEKE